MSTHGQVQTTHLATVTGAFVLWAGGVLLALETGQDAVLMALGVALPGTTLVMMVLVLALTVRERGRDPGLPAPVQHKCTVGDIAALLKYLEGRKL
ncbi:hypothetical protein JDV02_002491 [Purpureocillium takamizusanense]|uniref:Uncharacterized protein n=1 Tax=Purpureocillium takamizusanense TaxID=2060973 RepID=A0A9Q8Q8T5_9HYPO|nr:uncharacterized protein JDV02_002491 [Purpureocillium takamizusanense]UNI16014.1 hypothetical protein JDV02_002491 [Purpureocillium takamizusanense]